MSQTPDYRSVADASSSGGHRSSQDDSGSHPASVGGPINEDNQTEEPASSEDLPEYNEDNSDIEIEGDFEELPERLQDALGDIFRTLRSLPLASWDAVTELESGVTVVRLNHDHDDGTQEVEGIEALINRLVANPPSPEYAARRSPDVGSILNSLNITTLAELPQPESGHGPSACSICLEAYVSSDVIVVASCHASHQFHRDCLQEWLQGQLNCPLCRTTLELPESTETD